MTFTADSHLAVKVVPAGAHEQGLRPGGHGDIRAVCIHMAEGGGTVSWLAHDDGNSSHYVVEYGGHVVQMVRESWWAGSINPKLIRLNNDPAYTYLGESVAYGRSAVLSAIGKTAGNDPNRYVIAIETEGFAKDGPNAAQRTALAALVSDIRKRHGPLPVLGHRDFQSYKACPGHTIPWADYGGHALKASAGGESPKSPGATPKKPPHVVTPKTPVESFVIPAVPTLAKVKADAWLYVTSALTPSPANIQVNPGREMPLVGLIGATSRIVDYVDSSGKATHQTYWVKTADIESTRPAP